MWITTGLSQQLSGTSLCHKLLVAIVCGKLFGGCTVGGQSCPCDLQLLRWRLSRTPQINLTNFWTIFVLDFSGLKNEIRRLQDFQGLRRSCKNSVSSSVRQVLREHQSLLPILSTLTHGTQTHTRTCQELCLMRCPAVVTNVINVLIHAPPPLLLWQDFILELWNLTDNTHLFSRSFR